MNRKAPKGAKGVYFGCGGLLGFLGGFVYFFLSPPHEIGAAVWGGAMVAVVFGVLAVFFGDRFFGSLRHWFWWGP